MKIAMWTTYSIKLSCAAAVVVYVLQSLHECVIFDDKDAVLCSSMRLSIHVKYPSRKWKRWNYSQAFLLHHVKISSHLLWEFEPVSTWWYTHTHSHIFMLVWKQILWSHLSDSILFKFLVNFRHRRHTNKHRLK